MKKYNIAVSPADDEKYYALLQAIAACPELEEYDIETAPTLRTAELVGVPLDAVAHALASLVQPVDPRRWYFCCFELALRVTGVEQAAWSQGEPTRVDAGVFPCPVRIEEC